MLLPRWLRDLPFTHHHRTGRPRLAQRFRPKLEALESRWVPSQLPLTVTSLGDSGPGTLRAAIQNADASAAKQSDNFKIDVKVSGTIDLLTPLPDLNANIAIQGPGASSLTIEQAPGASFTSTIVTVDGGQTASLSGLTIANGSAGGITNNGTLTMMACTVSGNSGFLGGGIDNNRTLTVSGCTVSGNSAFEGGGIDNQGSLAIRDSFLTCNTASIGGGIANFPVSSDTTVTISGSTLSGNSATAIVLPGRVVGGVGGAIFNEGDLGSVVTVTVSDSILSNNSATLGGGAIFSDGIRQATTVTVKGCTLSGNTASQGAAIDNAVGSTLVVSGSTISGNTASDSGGGVYNAGTATLEDSTLSANTAASAGGGIFNADSGTLTVDDSHVCDSLALLGADLYNLGHATLHDSTIVIIGP